MSIKKTNFKRLASLSAFSAGALTFSSGTAEASSIVFSGVLDDKIGFSHGFGRHASFTGPSGVGATLNTVSTGTLFGERRKIALDSKPGVHGTQFQFLASFVPARSLAEGLPAYSKWHKGCKFSGCATVERGNLALVIAESSLSTQSLTSFSAKDRYFLFRFAGGDLARDLYGWAQVRIAFTQAGPDATLVDWAYDSSGAKIPSGDTGAPEPSTFVLTGLAALALGAKGLRAWRAARKTV